MLPVCTRATPFLPPVVTSTENVEMIDLSDNVVAEMCMQCLEGSVNYPSAVKTTTCTSSPGVTSSLFSSRVIACMVGACLHLWPETQ